MAWSFGSYSQTFYDIALYQGEFYAIKNRNNVFVCYIDGDIVFTEHIAFCKETKDYIHKYLVGSSRDLLLVSCIWGGLVHQPDEFINEDVENDIEDVNTQEDEFEEEQEWEQ